MSGLVALPDFRRITDKIIRSEAKSLAVVSQFAGEGKTLLTATLAVTLSRLAGLRVMVVDANGSSELRRFLWGRAKDVPPLDGGQSKVELIVARAFGTMPSLERGTVLSYETEPLNQNEVVSEFDLLRVIGSRAHCYDVALIDTCAMSSVGEGCFDPAIIARGVDRALAVLSPVGMTRESLASLKSCLTEEGVRPLGFVLNVGGPRESR